MTRTESRIRQIKREQRMCEVKRCAFYTLLCFLSFALCVAAAALGVAIGNYMELNKPVVGSIHYKASDQRQMEMLLYTLDCEKLSTYRCI